MVDIKTLLPELRELVSELAENLLARSTETADIDAGLRQAFRQIEKGGRTAQAFEVWRTDYLDQVAVGDDYPGAMINERFAEPRRHHALGKSHPDRGGDALAQRPGGRLDRRMHAVFRMPSGAGMELAKALQLCDT